MSNYIAEEDSSLPKAEFDKLCTLSGKVVFWDSIFSDLLRVFLINLPIMFIGTYLIHGSYRDTTIGAAVIFGLIGLCKLNSIRLDRNISGLWEKKAISK